MQKLHVESGGRYPVLRSLAILQIYSAVGVLIGGVVGMIYIWSWAPASAGEKMIMSAGVLASTFFLVIMTLAFAELIKLLIDIEHNTRLASHTPADNGLHKTPEAGGRMGRILDGEETAEAALIRGH